MTHFDKENSGSVKRKRAQSLGGEALLQLRKQQLDYQPLSPRKKARRSLVPGRSILKAATNQSSTGPFYSEEQDTLNITLTFANTTDDLTDRRKSLSRRVSFAPTAHLREFTKDSPDKGNEKLSSSEAEADDAPAPTAQIPSGHARQHSRQSSITSIQQLQAQPRPSVGFALGNESQDISMDMADDDVTAAFSSFQFPASRQADLLDEEQPSFADESMMDMLVDPQSVTSAFAHHTVIQKQLGAEPASDTDSEGSVEASIAMALGAGHEYEVPLGQEGISVSSPNHTQDDGEGDTASTMEESESMDMEATTLFTSKGMVVSDGMTSRRISVGGTMRRGSLAPGQAALALLDAEEQDTQSYEEPSTLSPPAGDLQMVDTPAEEDEVEMDADETMDADKTIDMDHKVAFSQNYEDRKQPRMSLNPFTNSSAPASTAPSPARRSPGRALATGQPSPRRIVSNEAQRARPPSSLAAVSPEKLKVLRTPTKAAAQPFKPRASVAFQSEPRPEPSHPFKAQTRPVQHSPKHEAIEAEDADEEIPNAQDVAPAGRMTIDEFLHLTNTEFMDDMFAGKRKSMYQAHESGETTTMMARPSFADQIVAMGCLVHDLETYHTMSKELRKQMSENIEFQDSVATILLTEVPAAFRRYQNAGEEERHAMETRFKVAKSHFRMQVKMEWYTYRSTAVEHLCSIFQAHVDGIEQDRGVIRATAQELDDLLPSLEVRQKELEQALSKENARRAELDACDQDHLAGLREAIAEQNVQIEDYARQNQEVEEAVERAQQRIAQLEAQKQEFSASIDTAQSKLRGAGSATKATLQQLQADFQALQHTQSWSLVQFNASEVKLVHCGEVCLVLSLGSSGIKRLELSLFESEEEDDYQKTIKAFLFDRMKMVLEPGQREGAFPSVGTLLRKTTATWATAARLLEEFTFVNKRFPLETRLLTKKSRPAAFLRVAARVHSEAAASSFFVHFELTGEETSSAALDEAACDIGCSVEVQFGHIDPHELTYVVRDRVSRGGPLCLLDACIQAEQRFR